MSWKNVRNKPGTPTMEILQTKVGNTDEKRDFIKARLSVIVNFHLKCENIIYNSQIVPSVCAFLFQ